MASIAKCNQIISRLPIRVRVVQRPMVRFCSRTATTRLTETVRSCESRYPCSDIGGMLIDCVWTGHDCDYPKVVCLSLGGLPTQGTFQVIPQA